MSRMTNSFDLPKKSAIYAWGLGIIINKAFILRSFAVWTVKLYGYCDGELYMCFTRL